jgi:acyl-CoA reductase-like NAD-dependent aldehyde dehydrogenase
MYPHYPLLIGGRRVEGAKANSFPSVNPYNGETWATIAQADESDVRSAVSIARHVFSIVLPTYWNVTPTGSPSWRARTTGK